MTVSPRSRRGAALVVALVGLLLLEAAIAGLLFVCTQEALIANAAAARLRARIAAASAIHETLATWPADSARRLAPGGVHHVPGSRALAGGATFSAAVERLHGSWFVIHGTGRGAGASLGSARAAALVWTADLALLWRDLAAPLVAEGDIAIGPAARLDGLSGTSMPPPWSTATCPAEAVASATSALGPLDRPALAAAPAAAIAIDAAATLSGAPVVQIDSALAAAPGARSLGGIDLDVLGSVADHVEAGSLYFAPVVSRGACDTQARGNAGDPFDPAAPCADFHPLIYAPGDLEITGGEGQGLLVVRGTLRLAAGARFAGAIVAERGVVAEGATVLGAVRTGAASAIDGALTWNACALWRAFTRTPALRRPWRRSTRWWLPSF